MRATALLAAVACSVWLAPTAAADPQDQAFLSYLRMHKAVVDQKTALDAAHLACAQLGAGLARGLVEDTLFKQFPTTINGSEYWIVEGVQQTYCPPK